MPGLTQEWWDAEIWDHDNLEKQIQVVDINVENLLKGMTFLSEVVLAAFKEKHRASREKADLITWEIQQKKHVFELQRDLAALKYFVEQWFSEAISEIDFTDRNGIKWQIERIMNDAWIDPFFPQLVKDAEIVLKTDWHKPPVTDMYIFKVASDVLTIHEIDWWLSNPEAIEFDNIVDNLREAVWDDLDLNAEIDRIISLKVNYADKVRALHESEILEPYMK